MEDKRFQDLPSELGYTSLDDLRDALGKVGVKPPDRVSKLINGATIESWRRKLSALQAEADEAGRPLVRRSARRVAGAEGTVRRVAASSDVPEVVAAPEDAAPASLPVVETLPEAPAAAESEPEAAAPEVVSEMAAPEGVRRRNRFATVQTRPVEQDPAPAPEAAPIQEPPPEASVVEGAAVQPEADASDEPTIRKTRFATVVTREPAPVLHAPTQTATPEVDPMMGPDATASPIRSRFQTVHTTGAQDVVPTNLGPVELAALARRDIDRGLGTGGARVLGALSREVLSERLDVDRRDGAGRPGVRPAPGTPAPADAREDKKKAKKGKRIVQSRDLYDKSAPGKSLGGGKRKGGRGGQPASLPPRLTTIAEHKRVVKMEEAILVGELASQMSVKSGELVMKLAFDLGLRGANINTALDFDTATLLADLYGYKVEQVGFDLNKYLPTYDDSADEAAPRPPVVTVMGHVDHGKTSLLDAIRSTSVATGEAGGITQHIGAYMVSLPSGSMTFLDTPGHEAFSALRARGAQATDIVVLVVAADDGIMPQTVEAIRHAQAAEVPILVALNKIDKQGADPERIKQGLTEYQMVPEEWGGSTIYVETSAKSGHGVLDLLEMINLQAEVMALTANPKRPAEGLVIESKLDTGRGPVATVLVQQGTLKVGETVVAGQFYGRVRTLADERGQRRKEAGPSHPVEITGLAGVPAAGERFYVVDSEKNAKSIAEHIANQLKQSELAVSLPQGPQAGQSADEMVDDFMKQSRTKELKVIVKADAQGSVQALCQSLTRLSTDKVRVRILSSGVGAIIENDVNTAMAAEDPGAVVLIGFNVKAEQRAQSMADQQGIGILTHAIIYEILNQVTERMKGMLDPVYIEEYLGKAECRLVFQLSSGIVAGCMVLDGTLERNARGRVRRSGQIVHEGPVSSIRHHKEDVREIRQGFECGISMGGFTEPKEGDIIECFRLKQIQATL